MNSIYQGKSEKLNWQQARQEVSKVNEEFAKIIDKLNPGDKYWLIKARYPYGSLVMDKSILHMANPNGDIVPFTDSSINTEIQQGLSYNLNSHPVSIILKNSFEIYLPVEDRILALSGLLQPGTTFGAWRVINPEHTQQPAFIWDMTAGARSVFMLPKITETDKHKRIEKSLGISISSPRKLMQHWTVFKEIANSKVFNNNAWDAEILYFSDNWFNHLNDKAWHNFYQYFYRSGWASTEYWRNQPLWNLVFSLVIKDYESRPSANIIDTAQYLLNLGVGTFTGLGPAQNTQSGPWDIIQQTYTDIYGLKNYPPVIIQPQMFNLADEKSPPAYYSLQFPNAMEFKPSNRKRTRIISDLHEIRSLMCRYERDLLSNKFNLKGTSLFDLFHKVKYEYFHNTPELHIGMKDTSKMVNDLRLKTTVDGKIHDEFPAACLFGRGCIRISHQ